MIAGNNVMLSMNKSTISWKKLISKKISLSIGYHKDT